MEPVNYLALSLTPGRTGAGFVRSALPDAPVVPVTAAEEAALRRSRRAPRTRSVIAGGLYRLGDAIAPSTPQAQPEPITA
jgi:hypothetical protein